METVNRKSRHDKSRTLLTLLNILSSIKVRLSLLRRLTRATQHGLELRDKAEERLSIGAFI